MERGYLPKPFNNGRAKAIPDTYTLYIMKYYHKGDVNAAPEMKKAIQMRPDNVEMYPDYVSYLMQTGDEELMADILKRWYNSGTYSPSLLNYAYNALSGMKANSLIFVNGAPARNGTRFPLR